MSVAHLKLRHFIVSPFVFWTFRTFLINIQSSESCGEPLQSVVAEELTDRLEYSQFEI